MKHEPELEYIELGFLNTVNIPILKTTNMIQRPHKT